MYERATQVCLPHILPDVANYNDTRLTFVNEGLWQLILSPSPLTHTLRQLMIFMSGCRIGFYRGEVKELLDDIRELRPTGFTSVPRLLNKVYDKVYNIMKCSFAAMIVA